MKQRVSRWLGLMLFPLAVYATPILIAPPQLQSFAGSSLANLRVLRQSANGTEAILTVDFIYDGLSGSSARLLPVITDKKRPKVSDWFGADPVGISSGRGTVSLRVKFFNDEPGVPAELTTDHVRILMLTDGGNAVISQGIFSKSIKWGSPSAAMASNSISQPSPAQAQLKAEEDQRIAQERARSEQAARDARLNADADAKTQQEADAKRLAEQQAKADAKRIADEKSAAEAYQAAAKKTKAELEAQRLADEKALAKTEAKRLADEKAKAQADAEAQRIAEEKANAEAQAKAQRETATAAPAETAAPPKPAFIISPKTRTRVTNIDIVNRNLDRTEMMMAVEYQYSKDDGPARLGVDLASTDDPALSDYFSSSPVQIGKGSRNFVMFPVKLNVAAAQGVKRATLPTDKVWIYLQNAAGEKSYIFQGTMMLVWRVPGAPTAPASATSGNMLEIESFKQNDLFSGYVTVKYNLQSASGALRLRIFDSATPATADWFSSDDVPISSGPGLQLVRIAVPKNAASPDLFNADTVEIQMLDATGRVLTQLRKQSPMSWAKPK